MNLYDHLVQYTKSGIYPMHMPGHKRNPTFVMDNPYTIDVTEVEGTDNLHHPEGIIRELMVQMQRIYKTIKSYPLVGGSTCGILTAVSACCRRGDTIIMGRNCHRSVYHAVYLLGLRPVYLYPEQDADTGISLDIQPEQVREVLRKYPEAACVLVTSPTYEGVMSDIQGIADAAHEKGIPVVVDEAHGAHLTWGEHMPKPAMSQGADVVIESLHKTLPAFTQTGVLHLCSDRVKEEVLERYLDIYETSSPSYILMAGVAQCMDWMEQNGNGAFSQYEEQINQFRKKAESWRVLSLWKNPKQEPSKLVILTGTSGMTGQQLAGILREKYQIEVEMEALSYILAMTSICDRQEGFERLAAALTEVDAELVNESVRTAGESYEEEAWYPEICLRAYDAMNCPFEEVDIAESRGRIAAEYAFIYPPGIPFLVPGERISDEVIRRIQTAKKKKLALLGLADETGRRIRVCLDRKGE